jgi:hypothetical protein
MHIENIHATTLYFGNALCKNNIGPPANPYKYLNLYFRPRKISAYFKAIPRHAIIHIHNRTPGPPICTARAVVAIFPIPTQPPRAVKNIFIGFMPLNLSFIFFF